MLGFLAQALACIDQRPFSLASAFPKVCQPGEQAGQAECTQTFDSHPRWADPATAFL